jgi:hypothetical protein
MGLVQTGEVCTRDYDDPVRDVFCADAPPPIRSLSDVQRAFGVEPEYRSILAGFAVTGHSTAVSARSVSAINPRIIFVESERPLDGQQLFALAFARGDQIAEMVVRDRVSNELRFYLLTYKQACNAAASGCGPADLLTPATESGWQDVTLRDEEDLKNTELDCRQCHQPDGPGTPKLLRMQEEEIPWTHWFDYVMDGGQALIADYLRMKGDESFAGVSAARMDYIEGSVLPGFVRRGGLDQPNAFQSARIEFEVQESAPGQPVDNSTPGESAAWREQYEIASRGESISVPYHDVKVTDPQKLEAAIEAYQSYQRGELPPEALPDFRDIFPDDPKLLAELGFATEPGLDGEGVLLQACAQCHNERLDQTISRADFIADLSKLDDEQRAEAIKRVQLPIDDPLVMPPARFRRLSDEAKERLVGVLQPANGTN